MRTIKYVVNVRMGPDMNVSVSTESIVDDEPDALFDEGKAAHAALMDFVEGVDQEAVRRKDEPS